MKTILIALDYDPTAKKIAEAGFELARATGAQLYLLHVISDPVYYSDRDYSPIRGFNGYLDLGALQTGSLEDLRKASLDYLTKTREYLGDETIRILVGEGDFADQILKTAAQVHADAIVIGSHSQKWLEKIVMGSVTEKVLSHTNVPLYIIPTKKRY